MVTDAGEPRSFRVSCPDVQQVYLVGDFNRWAVPGIPMEEEKPGAGRWSVRVRLPRGEQRLGFYAMNWLWNCEWLAEGTSRRGYAVRETRWVGCELTVSV